MSNLLLNEALIDGTAAKIKKTGKFDEMRKIGMLNIDENPAYLNLEQIVNTHVSNYLEEIRWCKDLNKNNLRSQIKSSIIRSNLLETGIETIIHQILNSCTEESSPSSIVKNFVNKYFIELKKEFEPQYQNEFIVSEINKFSSNANSSPVEPKEIVSSSTVKEHIICPKSEEKTDEKVKYKETKSSEVLVIESDGGGISDGSVYDIDDFVHALSEQETTENSYKKSNVSANISADDGKESISEQVTVSKKNHINKNESSNNLKRTFPEQNVEEQITNEIITSNNDDFSHEEHMPNVFTNITQYKEEESSKVASKEDNQIKKRKKHKNRKRKKNVQKSTSSSELNNSDHNDSPKHKRRKKYKKKSKKKYRHYHKDKKESSVSDLNENSISRPYTPQPSQFYPKEKKIDVDNRQHSTPQLYDQHQYNRNPYSQSSRVFPQEDRGRYHDSYNYHGKYPPRYSSYSYHSRNNTDKNYSPPPHPAGHRYVTPSGGNRHYAPPPTRNLTPRRTTSYENLNKS